MTKKMTSIFALALLVGLPSLASADITSPYGFTNGNFSSFTGGYTNPNTGTVTTSQLLTATTSSSTNYTSLTGWTVTGGTYGFLMSPGMADTTGSYSPQFNNIFKLWGNNLDKNSPILPATSPDGGNYVALDGASGYHGGGIQQTLTGLTIGQAYAVNFYWASGQQYGYDGTTTESLQVTFGNQVQNTATVTNVSHGFTDWTKQTMVFTAGSTSQTLNFLANGMPSGLPPMVLLDGITFAAVPEPASLALTGVGLVVAGVVHRVRRRGVSA